MKRLGKNIRILRKSLNETQAELGLRIGKGQSTIGNWENEESEPNLDELIQLSDIFSVAVDDLLLHDFSKGKPSENGYAEQETPKSKGKGNVRGKLSGQNDPSEDSFTDDAAGLKAAVWALFKVVKEIKDDTSQILANKEKEPK